jgi:hypothetical protein
MGVWRCRVSLRCGIRNKGLGSLVLGLRCSWCRLGADAQNHWAARVGASGDRKGRNTSVRARQIIYRENADNLAGRIRQTKAVWFLPRVTLDHIARSTLGAGDHLSLTRQDGCFLFDGRTASEPLNPEHLISRFPATGPEIMRERPASSPAPPPRAMARRKDARRLRSCAMPTARHFEGIVSKRLDKPYRSGRSGDWIKTKDSDIPRCRAVRGGQW